MKPLSVLNKFTIICYLLANLQALAQSEIPNENKGFWKNFGSKAHSFLDGLQFGLGGFNRSPFKTQKDKNSDSDPLSIAPQFIINGKFSTNSIWYFLPEWNFISERNESNDYLTQINRFALLGGYQFFDRLMFRFGTSLFITKISGNGGNVEIINGTSTSTYYRPKDASESYNMTTDVGLEYSFKNNLSLRSDLNIWQILENESRSLSFSLSAHYFFEEPKNNNLR